MTILEEGDVMTAAIVVHHHAQLRNAPLGQHRRSMRPAAMEQVVSLPGTARHFSMRKPTPRAELSVMRTPMTSPMPSP